MDLDQGRDQGEFGTDAGARLETLAPALGLALALFALIAVWPSRSWAAKGGGGDYAPILELGMDFHTGTTSGSSLTGANGYDLTFRSEKRSGFFRPSIAADIEFSSGNATITGTPAAYTLYGASFDGGVFIFPFQTGRFQPYFGGSGVLGWDILKMASPPSGVDANSMGLSFGYLISAGVDIRLGSVDGNALRIDTGYWAVSGSLAGGGFVLNGWRFSLGLVY